MAQAIETLLKKRDFKRSQTFRLRRYYKISHGQSDWEGK